jgi:hypothetical protein
VVMEWKGLILWRGIRGGCKVVGWSLQGEG